MQIRCGSFCAKLLTDRQTDRQTNNDDYISSSAEVTINGLGVHGHHGVHRSAQYGTGNDAAQLPQQLQHVLKYSRFTTILLLIILACSGRWIGHGLFICPSKSAVPCHWRRICTHCATCICVGLLHEPSWLLFG